MKNKLENILLFIVFTCAITVSVWLFKLSENPIKVENIIKVAAAESVRIENPSITQLRSKITAIIQQEGKLHRNTAELYSNYVISASDRTGISISLVLAVIGVESNFNTTAQNNGAMGLMQVVASVHKINMPRKLYNPEYNIQVGTGILKDNIHQGGGISDGLALYNGSYGVSTVYSKKVLLRKQRYDKLLYT